MSTDSPDIDRQPASISVSLDEPLVSSAACLDAPRCAPSLDARDDTSADLHSHDSARTADTDGNATDGFIGAPTTVVAG